MRHFLLAVTLFSLLIHMNYNVACADEPENFLRNPGFEEAGVWNTIVADANDIADPRNINQSHGGKYSAYTKATTIGGDGYAFVYQNVSVPVSSSLEFSFWLYVKRPELPFQGYIKGFVETSGNRYFDLGIWSDLPKPRSNEHMVQTQVDRYDSWFRVNVDLGRRWIEEAKFPEGDTITAVSLGIYNGLVYALPENLLCLEVFFDDAFLGPSTPMKELRFPWLIAVSCLISVAIIFTAILVRRRSVRTLALRSRECLSSKGAILEGMT